jgi:hypothetical protein
MRKKIILLFSFCLTICLALSPFDEIFSRNASATPEQTSIDHTLSDKSRKLSLKEKILLRILRSQIKKQQKALSEQIVLSTPVAGCSKIVLKKGDIIEANIIQINPTEIKYKRCGKPNDPEIVLAKKDVLSVTAEDGEVIFRNTGNIGTRPDNNNSDEPKLDGLAVASLATGVGGLLIGLVLSGLIGILAGIVGIVLGGISIYRIKRNPDKYRGKGMAWAGAICGIVIVGLFIILIAVYI